MLLFADNVKQQMPFRGDVGHSRCYWTFILAASQHLQQKKYALMHARIKPDAICLLAPPVPDHLVWAMSSSWTDFVDSNSASEKWAARWVCG